jgi:diguanylate cyclase (GGDEF)-like protein
MSKFRLELGVEQKKALTQVAIVALAGVFVALFLQIYFNFPSPSVSPGSLRPEFAFAGVAALIMVFLYLAFFAVEKYYSLKDKALYDYLTKTCNRHYFAELLNREFDKAGEYAGGLSLLMIDVDHFKFYNDREGHQAGDRLLTELAALLKANLHETDVLARYGGEEFVVLMPETDEWQAKETAQRLCAKVRAHPFAKVELQPGRRLTLSMGVASFSHASGAQELVKHADDALYEAKKAGRDRVCVWMPGGLATYQPLLGSS